MQEEEPVARDPWRVLVACVLLNRTSGRAQVAGVLPELFERYPEPFAMAVGSPSKIERIVRPCGLQRRRAATLRRLSCEWCELLERRSSTEWPTGDEVAELHGVGGYAEDAYRMVVLGERVDEPRDKVLAAWQAGQTL